MSKVAICNAVYKKIILSDSDSLYLFARSVAPIDLVFIRMSRNGCSPRSLT